MCIRLSKNTFPLAVLVIAIIISYVYFTRAEKNYRSIVSFSSCASAGYSISTTYPETCSIPGKTFVNEAQIASTTIPALTTTSAPLTNDFRNLSYLLDGQSILLTNGVGILPHTDKEATTTLGIVGKELVFDINGDSLDDTTFLLKRAKEGERSESTYYYLTSALSLNTGYVGLNILSIGEASTTPSLIYKNGFIYVTYTDTHTQKIERRFVFDNNLLKEVIIK